MNVSIYSSVEFSCSAVNSDLIYFTINGTSASNLLFTLKGFNLKAEEIVGANKIRRNLTLTSATVDINNTEIYCRAGGDTIIDSDIAVLKIQG